MRVLKTRDDERGIGYPISMEKAPEKSPLPSMSGMVCVEIPELKARIYRAIWMATIPDVAVVRQGTITGAVHKNICHEAVNAALKLATEQAKKDLAMHVKTNGCALTGNSTAVNKKLQQKGDAQRAEEARRLSPRLKLLSVIGGWVVRKELYISRSSTRPRLVVDIECTSTSCSKKRTVRGCDLTGGKVGPCTVCKYKKQRAEAKEHKAIFERLKSRESAA